MSITYTCNRCGWDMRREPDVELERRRRHARIEHIPESTLHLCRNCDQDLSDWLREGVAR